MDSLIGNVIEVWEKGVFANRDSLSIIPQNWAYVVLCYNMKFFLHIYAIPSPKLIFAQQYGFSQSTNSKVL